MYMIIVLNNEYIYECVGIYNINKTYIQMGKYTV